MRLFNSAMTSWHADYITRRCIIWWLWFVFRNKKSHSSAVGLYAKLIFRDVLLNHIRHRGTEHSMTQTQLLWIVNSTLWDTTPCSLPLCLWASSVRSACGNCGRLIAHLVPSPGPCQSARTSAVRSLEHHSFISSVTTAALTAYRNGIFIM